ncbi:MAG: S9 family peptidase [bacterium]
MNTNRGVQILFYGWLLIAILVTFSSVLAQESQQGWTPENMIQFNRVGATAISPNGRLIAYTVSKPIMNEEKSEYLTHIWVTSADGKMNRQFTRGEKSCSRPAFSPDGKYLAFRSTRGDKAKNQIWLLPLAGGEAWPLTAAKSGVNSYVWSPDGKRIAFTMNEPETEEQAKNKKAKRDMKVLDNDYKYAHLYTIAVEGASEKKKVQRLTAGEFHVVSFDWSPDGRTIAFAHQKNPKADIWPSTDIATVPTDSGTVTELVTGAGFDGTPMYSPNGKWLAYTSDGGEPKWAFARDIYVLPVRGGAAKKLATTPDRRPQMVSWSADSKHIFFRETDRTSRRVFSVALNGTAPKTLTTGAGNFTGVSISRNGKAMVFVHQRTELMPDVYVSAVSKFKPRKLSNVNPDYPKFRMGRTSVITWNSKDGREIEGLLTYPVAYDIGRAYPLVLQIHGRPAGVYTQYYTASSSVYPIQAFAQQEFAVLRVNPRGSSGYGKDFRFANYNDWGFGDFDDLMAGVNKVVGMNVAHPDSLCVMGWSYGGYMTSFIVTKSNRFKAASVGAGVTNLMSFTGTADIPSFLPDYFGGEPWDKLDTYMKHSAMFQVKGVTIPTQIIHGENDRRVPLSQGLELYNALKRQGCATEMIVYPRTAHGPREPKFIQDIGERILAWFNKQLGRKGFTKSVVTK